MAKKIEYLGLDFGSSKTCLVAKIQGEDTPIVFTSSDEKICFPSVIAEAKQGNFTNYKYFNDASDNRDNKYVTYSTLKEDLRYPDTPQYKEDFARIKAYLSKIFDCAFSYTYFSGKKDELYDFSELKAVYYGHPSFFNTKELQNYENNMQMILQNIFSKKRLTPNFRGIPEPILTAQAYLATHAKNRKDIKTGDSVLILDFGGYTLDIALVTVGKDKGKVGIVPGSNCSFNTEEGFDLLSLGKTITHKLYSRIFPAQEKKSYLMSIVDQKKCELFEAQTMQALNEKVVHCNLASGTIRFSLSYDGKKHENTVSFIEGKNNINMPAHYEELFEHIKCFFLLTKRPKTSISHVLFAGGTSRMLPLRKAVYQYLYDNDWFENGKASSLVIDEESDAVLVNNGKQYPLSSECAVALGACLAAENGLSFDSVKPKQAEKEIKKLKKKIEELEIDIKRFESKAVYEYERYRKELLETEKWKKKYEDLK